MTNLKTLLKNVNTASRVYYSNDIIKTKNGYCYLSLQADLLEAIDSNIVIDEFIVKNWCSNGKLGSKVQLEMYKFCDLTWEEIEVYNTIAKVFSFLDEFKEYRDQLNGVKKAQSIYISQDEILNYNLNLTCTSCGSDWTGSNSTKIHRTVKNIKTGEYGDLEGVIKVSGKMLQVTLSSGNNWNLA